MSEWETVIGLETHVELLTKTKIFCSCTTEFGGAPNTHCCPVCSGMPGALPVLNKAVLEYALRTSLSLNGKVTRYHKFDRKNYFYPDLPKAYQISQLYLPICRDGHVDITTQSGNKSIRIHEMHMEEDAGKLVHDPFLELTRADYNRCGVPLLEIVTEPDFRSAEEVLAYLERLRSILDYLGVSDCKMEEGSLRCDVNLSVRPLGSSELGTRTEMKNISSLKAISKAIAYESRRQRELLEEGGKVKQETRRWDDNKDATFAMRSKEEAQDYRYFPEPDLPPVEITEEHLYQAMVSLPEMEEEKKERYQKEFGLSAYDAGLITSRKALADFFEEAVRQGADPKETANWISGEILRLLKEKELDDRKMPLSPGTVVKLMKMVQTGTINRGTAVKVLDAVFDSDSDPESYVREHHLEQVQDEALLTETVEKVLSENPQSVDDYRSGKKKAMGFLVGQTMKLLKGKADPRAVNELLQAKLNQGKDV